MMVRYELGLVNLDTQYDPTERAFLVDKHGFRARGDWKACWEE